MDLTYEQLVSIKDAFPEKEQERLGSNSDGAMRRRLLGHVAVAVAVKVNDDVNVNVDLGR